MGRDDEQPWTLDQHLTEEALKALQAGDTRAAADALRVAMEIQDAADRSTAQRNEKQ
jgi:hypothetical protein